MVGKIVRISELKEGNIQNVRKCFLKGNIWVKRDLADATGMSLAAITNILQLLVNNNEIKFIGYADSSVGRKAKKYQINPDFRHYGTISCRYYQGQGHLSISRYSLLGEEISTKVIDEDITKDTIAQAAKDLISYDPDIIAIVFSIPGICRAGRIESSTVRGVVGLNLLSYLKDQLNCKVVIDNDITFAAVGFDALHQGKLSIFVCQDEEAYTRSVIMYDGEVTRGATDYAGTLLNDEEGDAFTKLRHQAATINSLIDPDIIGVYSKALSAFDERDLLIDIPIYHRTKIKVINDPEKEIKLGMKTICLKALFNDD